MVKNKSMFLRIRKEKYISKINQKREKIIGEFLCDECEEKFEKNNDAKAKSLKEFHFCSRKCANLSRKPGGSIRKKTENTCQKIYGGKTPMASEEIKNKVKQTSLEKYGVENPFQSEEKKKKIKKTCLELYGVDNPSKSPEIINKIRETFINKYGVDNPLKTEEVKEKIKKTCLERYGVDNPSKCPEIIDKIKNTFEENYEEGHPSRNKDIQEKYKQTCLELYGAENYFGSTKFKEVNDYKNSYQKAHQTKKKNGSYKKSNAEDEFYYLLELQENLEKIKRQIHIFGFEVDFFIKSINGKKVWIEFDGLYWHGLHKSLIDIAIELDKNPNQKQLSSIYKRYFRDRKQDQIFKKNNLKLLRFTDKEFKECKKINNYSRIIDKINEALK